MPATPTRKTPGVYVTELSAFPPSVVGVQTAIPAFIGYTQRAEIDGKPVIQKPIPITSLAEYEQIFGGAHKALYKIEQVKDSAGEVAKNPDFYDFRVAKSGTSPVEYTFYNLASEGSSFNLYNSMRLFYANGGANCYVVSAGLYETKETDGKIKLNKVELKPLQDALTAVQEQVGPTMLVCPDAVLLPASPAVLVDGEAEPAKIKPWVSADFQAVTRQMLEQAAALQDRVAILDLYGTQTIDQPPAKDHEKTTLSNVVDRFREDVGEKGLSYGMAYFPFLDTTVIPVSDLNYTSIENKDTVAGETVTPGMLKKVLTDENENLYAADADRKAAVQSDINKIGTDSDPVFVRKLNDNLTAALPLLTNMLTQVVNKEDLLPPSAAMAGVMTWIDQSKGVWNAPANITLTSVARPSVLINSKTQADLNVPVNGKAIDALREFPGRGTVVWGARTLDGNSNDYRYIQVRRTLIYIEQSVKNALNQFVFAPNTGQTWATVVSMVSSFLTTVWNQGGLMGATASEAFSVECGLGSTMTGKDILEGYMVVQVTLQMIRPAEFIELTFKQKMEGVA